MDLVSAGEASSKPLASTPAAPIPSGLAGRTIPSLAPTEAGDSILGITPLPDTASFQIGSLGVQDAEAFVCGDVLAKLDERLYAAFDPLQVRVHLHALERTPHSHAVLYSASLPLWTPPDPVTQLSNLNQTHTGCPRLPTSMPFHFRMTPDLPQCVHLPGSGVRYALTAELLVSYRQRPLDSSEIRVRKIVTSVPVHPMRYLSSVPLNRLLSSCQESEEARGRPPAYSDEPRRSPACYSGTSFATAEPTSSSSAPFTPADADSPAKSGVAGTVHIPPGYGLSSHVWSARYPTVVHAQLARTLFRRGEAMRINILIPPPPQGLATEKGLSLRSVEARLIRVITVTEPNNTDALNVHDPEYSGLNTVPEGSNLASTSASGSCPDPGLVAAPAENSGATTKQAVYEAQMSYSGKLARFSSSRAIALRLALHSPYHIASPPGPSAEIDRALYDVRVSSESRPEGHAASPAPQVKATRSELEAEVSAADLADVDAAQTQHQRENTACANISQETLFHKVEYEVRVRIALTSTRVHSRSPSPKLNIASADEKKAQGASMSRQHEGTSSLSGVGHAPPPPHSPARVPGASEDRPRDVHIRFSQKVFILPGLPPEAGLGLNSDGNPLWTEGFVDASDGAAEFCETSEGESDSVEASAAAHALRNVRAEKMRAAEALNDANGEDSSADTSRCGRVFEGFDHLEEFDGYEDSIIYEDGGASSSATGLDRSDQSTGGALLGTGLGSGPVPQQCSVSTRTAWDAPPAEDDPPPVGADDDLNEFEVQMGIEIGRRIAAIGAEGPVPQWTAVEEDDDLRPPPGEPPEESEAHADAHAALAGACEEDPPPPMPQSPPGWTATIEDPPAPSVGTRSNMLHDPSDVGSSSWDAPPSSAPPLRENPPDLMGLHLAAAAARQLSLDTSLMGQVRSRASGTRLHADPPPSFGDATAPGAPLPPPQGFSYAYPPPTSEPASRRPSSQSMNSVLVHGLPSTLHPTSANRAQSGLDAVHAPPPPPYRGSQDAEPDHGTDPHRLVRPPSYSDAGGSLLAPAVSIRPAPLAEDSPSHTHNATDDQELPTYAEYDRH